VNADGSGLTSVIRGDNIVSRRLAWSPDGTRIAFVSLNGIDIVNTDGSGLFGTLTGGVSDLPIPSSIAWSPDGGGIAFVSRTGEELNYALYVINVEGRRGFGLTRLVAHAGNDFSWSPVGQRIAFECGGEICVMNADGSGLTNLAAPDEGDGGHGGGGSYSDLSWSPDGTRIALIYFRGYDREDAQPSLKELARLDDVYVMNADGSGVTRLTDGSAVVTDPVWSPDGQRIGFIGTDEDGNHALYIINVDGSGLTVVSDDSEVEEIRYLTWSPVP
jgi:TolB protein